MSPGPFWGRSPHWCGGLALVWWLWSLVLQKGELVPLLDRFTAEEERQMKRILQRMDVLAKVRLVLLNQTQTQLDALHARGVGPLLHEEKTHAVGITWADDRTGDGNGMSDL